MIRCWRRFVLAGGLVVSLGGDGSATHAATAAAPPDLALPSLDQLADEGVPWLLDAAARERLAATPRAERAAAVSALLADPEPGTPVNEMVEGVRRRRALMLAESLTTADARARLLFLHGPPEARQNVDCSAAFHPLELWRYGQQRLILYRPSPDSPFRLWLPIDGKRVLYVHDMVSWLEDWKALEGRVSGARIDRRLCKAAAAVDAASGVDGLEDAVIGGGPDAVKLQALLGPPADLATWARAAAAEPVAAAAPALPLEPLAVSYPRRRGQRMETRLLVVLPPGAPVVATTEKNEQGVERRELRLGVEGVIESSRALFDSFRMRFTVAAPEGPAPLVLAVPRSLRPGRYVVRLRVRDEVGGAQAVIAAALEVPTSPQPAPPNDVVAVDANRTVGTRLDAALADEDDSLVLMVPPRDVIFDSVRAQAVVKGSRIQKVSFLLDGVPQLARNAPPWSVEVKLPRIPREQVLRAEGYDHAGVLIAGDELTLNQLTGQLEVAIVSPPARSRVVGSTLAKAEVVVPEDHTVKAVEFLVNERLQARLERPPWQATVTIPAGDLTYLTVSAELDDGSRAEDVRILAAPDAMAQVEVSTVELFTTVTDGAGELVRGLAAGDFAVREDGRPQRLSRAELVEDLPLVVGVTLDVSGSMHQALGEAQRAAATFLQRLVRAEDRCFAVAFSDRPTLVMPRTPDAAAVADAVTSLRADGPTSLYDALVFSLYYFRGTHARRALVVLSDGADTDSLLSYGEALAYARDSGVVIYTVGLNTEALDLGTRHKLEELAQATGGRSFVIANADELAGVYQRIEAELRSQYLLAYEPDRPASEKGFRRVEVEVARRGVKARTIPGYSP